MRPVRSALAAAALLLGPTAATAAAAGPADEAKPATVRITDAGFAKVSAMQVGDQVKLVNKGTQPHLATAKGPVAFTSPKLAPGASWAYTFTEPGTYTLLCTLHPAMKPTVVVVTPAGTSDATLAAAAKPLDAATGTAAQTAEVTTGAGAATDQSAGVTTEIAAAAPIDTRGGRTTTLLLCSFAAVGLLGLLSRGLSNGQP